ncbi:hypothetical protein EW146_g8873 [Bondarzewia mesenterica]|uniref:Uncharacterized protein n=1 Tax=Bondarzewia mesenterica TaxID=1095465 RepID=A0A4S4LAT6_9AGAM|nr:hypothetical protein EW146_g8873 [Bondarzewia mesenterica]
MRGKGFKNPKRGSQNSNFPNAFRHFLLSRDRPIEKALPFWIVIRNTIIDASVIMRLRNDKEVRSSTAATRRRRQQSGMKLRNNKILDSHVRPRATAPTRARRAKAAYGPQNADNIIAGISQTGQGIHLRFIRDLVNQETPSVHAADTAGSMSFSGSTSSEVTATGPQTPVAQRSYQPGAVMQAPKMLKIGDHVLGPRLPPLESNGSVVGRGEPSGAGTPAFRFLKEIASRPRVPLTAEEVKEGMRQAEAQRKRDSDAIREREWEKLRREGEWKILARAKAAHERLLHPSETMSDVCPTETLSDVCPTERAESFSRESEGSRSGLWPSASRT